MVRKIEAACISYLHLHNHTPPHKKILEAYNNNNRLLFLTVSKGQEFGSGSTGKYQLRASQEVDWGFSHLKTCPELGDPQQGNFLPCLADCCWLLMGCLSSRGLFECPLDLETSFPQSKSSSKSRQKPHCLL